MSEGRFCVSTVQLMQWTNHQVLPFFHVSIFERNKEKLNISMFMHAEHKNTLHIIYICLIYIYITYTLLKPT